MSAFATVERVACQWAGEPGALRLGSLLQDRMVDAAAFLNGVESKTLRLGMEGK
jgi:hypothetical protein